ncbi:MAG: aldehyde dehydrogenase family protein [Aggregatilineales bacterium]
MSSTSSSKVTYSTFAANQNLREDFSRALNDADQWLRQKHPFYVNGEARAHADYDEERSPNDHEIIIGSFARATLGDLNDAVESAAIFFREWSNVPWQERVAVVRRVAASIAHRRFELAAILAYEVGKPCLEAIGEVDECVDLVNYYCDEMERHSGFRERMKQLNANENASSVLRPYGVWAIIGPFNFPLALTLGPAAAALIAGNSVVIKPSPHALLSGLVVHELFTEAGVPSRSIQVLTIPDAALGDQLQQHSRISGLTFTGSYEVGMHIYRQFAQQYPRPIICEMGGKNPAIVTAASDLEKATAGVARSAFSFAGQRCSACSRAYVERSVYDSFVNGLVDKMTAVRVGTALDIEVEVGPVIDREAVDRFERGVADARSAGRVAAGGRVLRDGDLRRGNFVEPTVVEVPLDSRLFKDELFVPFVAVQAVDSLDQALAEANGLGYGLTAGLYSEDDREIEIFVRDIEAGVFYINRAAGATTGAWPGVQPFGGWKGSGSSGRAVGGPHYLQQYMREQSQTVVDKR